MLTYKLIFTLILLETQNNVMQKAFRLLNKNWPIKQHSTHTRVALDNLNGIRNEMK